MARYTGPVCRLCRREGEKLFLKGDKCTSKCTIDTRTARAARNAVPKNMRVAKVQDVENPEAQQPETENRAPQRSNRPVFNRIAPPGQHGISRKKPTEYSVQLREKQKCKRIYGLLEKQFREYYEKADTMRGVTGENMLSLIERRLDNVVFRMGLGVSRAQARQIVCHGLITVNGKVVNIPSFLVKVNNVVSVKESKKDGALFVDYTIPKNAVDWIQLATCDTVVSGTITRLPVREDCETNIKEHLIVELYSK